MSLPETYKVYFSSATHGGKGEFREVPLKKPENNQVLIKIAFAPINPTDIAFMGNTFWTPDNNEQNPVGSEGSGTIVAVGENLESPFKVGDKVHFTGKSWGEYKLVATNKIFPVQGDLSLEEAASHFINPATVYYMGVVAQRGGHKAAIHTAGSSALGRMLIKYFKNLDIKLINVVRREEYVRELKSEGADYVLNSQDSDFEKKLAEVLEKENVTMAIDAIAGDFANTLIKALPRGSTYYSYGFLSSTQVRIDVLNLFNQKKVEGLYIGNYIEETMKRNEYKKWMTEVHSLLSTSLSSKVQKVFKLEQVDEALAYYKENSSKGKILLQP